MPYPLDVLLGLLGRDADELIPICSQSPGATGLAVDWVRADSAGAFCDTLSGRNVWFAVQPTSRPEKGRGTSKNVTGLVALYCDLDYAKGDTGVGVDQVTALDVIAGLTEALGGVGPHAIVRTGAGLHPYWAIERCDQVDGALLLIRWKQVVKAVCDRMDIKLDLGVYDLPRILRAPGPLNHKYDPPAPTGLVVRHLDKPLALDAVHEAMNAWFATVPGLDSPRLRPDDRESMRALMANPGARTVPGTSQDQERVFTDAQAQEFLEEHAWRPARETPWGAGADYWKVLWQCAMVASHFSDMFDEEDLRERLREAVREGHGADPDARDEYQIELGFMKGTDWYARRPTEEEQLNPFSNYRDSQRIAESQGGIRAVGFVSEEDDRPTTSVTIARADGTATVFNPFAPGADREVGAGGEILSSGGDRADSVSIEGGGRRSLIFEQGNVGDIEETEWLWLHDRGGGVFENRYEHWMPLGELVILAGKPKLGKSQWAAKLAAWVTTGKMEGKYRGIPRDVILSTVEDSWSKTMLPRLAAAGADVTRCWRVRAVENESTCGLSLPVDMDAVAEMVRRQNVGMIVLDPLTSVIDSKIDTHKDAAVKKALEPLTQLAQETGVVILGLMHFNKSGAGALADRLMGSQAFNGTARAMLTCQPVEREGEHDLMEGDNGPRQFLFGQVTNNLGPLVENSVRYEIRSALVELDGKRIRTSKIEITSYKDSMNVEEAALEQEAARAKQAAGKGKETKAQQCESWLRSLLEQCERAWVDLKSLGEPLGYNEAMLRRCLSNLGVTKRGEYHEPIYALPGRHSA